MLNRVTKNGNVSSWPGAVGKLPRDSKISPVFNSRVLQGAYESVALAMRRPNDDSLEELQGAVEYLLDTVIAAKRASGPRGVRRSRGTRARPV